MSSEALRRIADELLTLPTRGDSDAEKAESAGYLLLAAINECGAWADDPAFRAMVQQRYDQQRITTIPNFSGAISAWEESVWMLRGKPDWGPTNPRPQFVDDCRVVALALTNESQKQQGKPRSGRTDDAAPTEGVPAVPANDAHLSPAKLAKSFNVHQNALEQRLKRWRKKNHNGWIENQERKPREARYLYQVGAIRPIIDAMKATDGATDKRPTKKK